MKKKLLLFGIPLLLILTGILMDNTRTKTWYHESTLIDCTLEDVNNSLNDIGNHYKELVTAYPGMTRVELVESGEDFVTLKTNEGTMKRTKISVEASGDKTLVEFDEEYITSKITTTSHFVETFEAKNDKTELSIEISNLVAPGFLGFFLRNFGSKNIGNGFLDSYTQLLKK